jgi:hypothetical protein
VHVALGYSSWPDYCAAEFDIGRSHAYRLLDAARVAELLEESSPQSGDSVPPLPAGGYGRSAGAPLGVGLPNEAVARELAPLKDDPDGLREAWTDITDRHGDRPTAGQTREVVEQRARTEASGTCTRKKGREKVACGKPALPGSDKCSGCTAHLALSKWEGRCGRMAAAHRETRRILVEDCGWSPPHADRKLKEKYTAARDALDGEGGS